MKRSKAFFHAAIKTHRERMLANFARAKKRTNQFLKESHQSTKDRVFIDGKDFLEKSTRVAKKIYFDVVVWIGRLSAKNERVVSLTKSYWKDIKSFFVDAYSRCVIRTEYTRRDFIAFFVVAFLLGIGIKSIAIQNITIGFEDYKLAPKETLYDMNLVQRKVIDQGTTSLKNNPRKGGVCSELDN